MEIKRNNLLGVIQRWGGIHGWKVSFDLTIRSEPSSWAGILHFTTGDNCCSLGDRIPFVKLYKDQLVILNAVNGNGNHQEWFTYPLNKKFNITIEARLKLGEVNLIFVIHILSYKQAIFLVLVSNLY